LTPSVYLIIDLCFEIISVPSFKEIHGKLPSVTSSDAISPRNISIQALMNSGVHLGHTTKIWHENMLPFIYGRRSGVHIINLEHTLVFLRRAMNVTREIAARGGVIIFVGSRPFMRDILVDAAQRSEQFYVTEKWLSGCLENHQQTLRKASKESWMVQPDLIVVLDMMESRDCIDEATRLRIPTIGLCDTDCDPLLVTYPVPGNDDSYSSVSLIARLLGESAHEGRRQRDQAVAAQLKNAGRRNNK
jgi:small subunit ribosomal protein S2